MSDFVKCSKGHVFDSELEKCPYCNGKKIEDELNKLPADDVDVPADTAMCYDLGPDRFRDFDDEK